MVSKYLDTGGVNQMLAGGYMMTSLSTILAGSGTQAREGNVVKPFLLDVKVGFAPPQIADALATWHTNTGLRGAAMRCDILSFENAYNATPEELVDRYMTYTRVPLPGRPAATQATLTQEHSQSTTASQIKVLRSERIMFPWWPHLQVTNPATTATYASYDNIKAAGFPAPDANFCEFKIDLTKFPTIQFDSNVQTAPIKNSIYLLIYSDQSDDGENGMDAQVSWRSRLHFNDM